MRRLRTCTQCGTDATGTRIEVRTEITRLSFCSHACADAYRAAHPPGRPATEHAPEVCAAVRQLRDAGRSLGGIARLMNLSERQVRRILADASATATERASA